MAMRRPDAHRSPLTLHAVHKVSRVRSIFMDAGQVGICTIPEVGMSAKLIMS